MSYQVLARKWRPRNFQDMIGQETILRMLTNALKQKRIHHAYLFTGTRGVGKTTLARIFAKCLNCETGITPEPCGTCNICCAIDNGKFLDLYEVDAASRTKVEDTRELLDNVLYAPTSGRYKVYLIDEVHMLSNHSFNALLKTLEEPPEYVKFLFATTDPKRLPITILSRCLQFHLTRITPEQISQYLQQVCHKETISFDIPGLEKISQAADGSMRDALSLLDQAIAYGQGSINTADVDTMLGHITQNDLLPLIDALANQDGQLIFQIINHYAEHAFDFQQTLIELMRSFHKISLAQIVPHTLPADNTLTAFVSRFTTERIQLYYQIALQGRRDLPFAASLQQGFEMTMLRMLGCSSHTPSQTPPIPEQTKSSILNEATSKLSEPQPITTVQPAVATPSTQWREILPKLELSGMAYALAANCMMKALTENKITLTLSTSHEPMLNQKLKDRLIEALSRYYQQSIQLEIMLTPEELQTPIKQEESEYQQRLQQAKNVMMQDPGVKQFLDIYDASVEVSLVT